LAPIEETTLLQVREELQTFIHRFSVEHAYFSDNPRGDKSSRILFPRQDGSPTIHKDARLNNIKQPEWSGRTHSAIVESALYKKWHTEPATVSFAGGESLADVVGRIESFLAETQGRSIFVCSHTTPMQVLLCKLLAIGYDKIWSFKFDHLAFTLIYENILLRYNSSRVANVDLTELKLPPDAKSCI
jgi:broad specificity phosphatase PhoE